MRQLTETFSRMLSSDTITAAWCWRVERRDGLIQGFTDHDVDIVIEGLTYQSRSGVRATAIDTQISDQASNVEIAGFLSSETIAEADLVGGLYDFAAVRLLVVDWARPPETLAGPPYDYLLFLNTRMGEIRNDGNGYEVELRGLDQLLNQGRVGVTRPTCPYDLGDERCRVDLDPFTHTQQVLNVTNNRVINLNDFAASRDRYFENGLITILNGQNAGVVRTIASYRHSGRTVVLFEPLPFPLEIGTAASVIAGCRKDITACKSVFDNFVNFGGEPFVPTEDIFLAGARGGG